MPLWQRMTNQLIEHPRFGWSDLVAAAGVGVLASVAAATVPAFGVARLLPVDALAGRFRATAPRARLSLLGVLLVLAGMGAMIASGIVGHDLSLRYQGPVVPYFPAPPVDNAQPVAGTLAGAVVTVAGLVLVMPVLVAMVGRLGERLPLSGRLAVRDAARHQHRTVAAGAAVMVAVAGSVVAAFVFTSRADTEPRTLPADTALAQLDRLDKSGDIVDRERTLEQVATNATRSVPGVVVDKVTIVSAQRAPNLRYPLYAGREDSTPAPGCWSASAKVGIGTPEVIELATGRKPDAGTRSALARGEVVVFDKCLVNQDGTVTLGLNQETPGKVPAHLGAHAPGMEGRGEYLRGALARLGLPEVCWVVLVLVVLAVAWRGARRAAEPVVALLVVAAAGLLMSPVSWSHHWVWIVPAVFVFAVRLYRNRHGMVVLAAVVVVFAAGHRFLPNARQRELEWTWWQHVLGNSYVLIALAFLIWCATTRPVRTPAPAKELVAA